MDFNVCAHRFKRTEFPHLMDVSRALTHVQQALELAPTNAVVTYSLAGVYSIANQLEQAIELYERAFRLDPKLEIAFFEAVQLKFTICDWKNRDALLAKIVALVEEQLAKALNNSLLKRDDTATLLTPYTFGLRVLFPDKNAQLACVVFASSARLATTNCASTHARGSGQSNTATGACNRRPVARRTTGQRLCCTPNDCVFEPLLMALLDRLNRVWSIERKRFPQD